MPSPKEKLNSILGISPDQGIDSYLDDLETTTAEVNTEVKKTFQEIDKSIADLQNNPEADAQWKLDTVARLRDNLKGIDELVSLSTNLIKHLYTNIISTDLIDPELIEAAANLIKATHDNIAEYIDLYKDREKFYERIQLEMLKHKNNLELLNKKYELESRKLSDPLSADPENLQTFDQDKIIRMLKDMESDESLPKDNGPSKVD